MTRLEFPKCKLCAGLTVHFMDCGQFAIVKCSECGFMFAPLREGYDLRGLYANRAYWFGGPDCGYLDYDREWQESARYYLARLQRINQMLAPGRLLEVGSAAGYFLKAARESGWSVAGVEVSDLMRARCMQNLDCPLFGSVQEVCASGRRFECVAMFEVLEHLPDPAGALREIRDLMTEGGLLALSTPNFEGYEAGRNAFCYKWFAPPAHISYFGPSTLSACVEQAGFRKIELGGLFNAAEIPLPRPLAALLRPFRRGKRLRPGGIIGRMIKSYQRRRPGADYWIDTLELYARRV